MRTATIIVSVLLVAALIPGSDAGPTDDILPPLDHWIVGFHDTPLHQVGDTYLGNPIIAVNGALRFIVVETNNPLALKLDALVNPEVRYVEYDDPNYAHLAMSPNDPLHTHSALWGTRRVGGEAAWDTTTGSTAVKIAVVDSGLNKNHEEFAGQSRVLNGFNFHGGNTDTSDQNGCNYHGTHVTGTLGATINNGKGIAGLSQSSILPVKIFGSGFFGCGAASTSNIANALKYAGDQGAHISQNSWGGGSSSTAINDAITYSHNKGVIHVAAAGNSGPCTNCVNTPWVDNANKVIIVSSSDSNDAFSSFSSQGPQVTVIAPGGSVGSSTSGTSDYHIMSGTSMAAPHVSGSLGLYLAVNPGASFSTAKNALTSTAEDLGHSSDRQGAGLVRADLLVGGGGGGGGGDPEPEPDPPASDMMHVHSISHGRQGNPNTGSLLIDIAIRDANEAGVASADICITVTRDDGLSANGCGATDASGNIRFTWSGVGRATFTTCVTDLTKTGWTWDTAADHASSGNCHTARN